MRIIKQKFKGVQLEYPKNKWWQFFKKKPEPVVYYRFQIYAEYQGEGPVKPYWILMDWTGNQFLVLSVNSDGSFVVSGRSYDEIKGLTYLCSTFPIS